MLRSEINRLIAHLKDETKMSLDRRSMIKLVDELCERERIAWARHNQLEQVRNFNYKFPGRTPTPKIGFGTAKELALGFGLLEEELEELQASIVDSDFVGACDAVCDLQYVLLNMVAVLGLHHEEVWYELFEEVHRSNMSKFTVDGPIIRDDGKLLKGPDFSPPRIREILESRGWEQPTLPGTPKE